MARGRPGGQRGGCGRPSVVAAALLVALALAPGTGAGETRSSAVDVVGAGTLVWPRVAVRAKPSASSPRIGIMRQFRPDFSPQYVLALSAVHGKQSESPTWYRVSIPGRPNGRAGWVRAASLELWPVRKRLVVYRSERRFEFWDGDKLVRAGRVAVGKPGAETPTGLFYVTAKFDPTAPILGAFALETSAYSKLSDWPGGGVVGVHGTPWPWLLGEAVSHGCVRLHNDDILFLRWRIPPGTPVKIVP